MHVRYYLNKLNQTLSYQFKNELMDDIYNIMNGTHTSVADFSDTACNKTISTFAGTVPPQYKDFANNRNDSSFDSDYMITFTKWHVEADSEYKFRRKISIYVDDDTNGPRVRTYFPDSDLYDAYTVNPGFQNRGNNYNRKVPGNAATNYWLNGDTYNRALPFDNVDYIDIIMTKHVFGLTWGYNLYGAKGTYFVADMDIREIDKIAYNAVFDSDRRNGFALTSLDREKCEARAYSPQVVFSAYNWNMGVPLPDNGVPGTDHGVYLSMGGMYKNNKYYDDALNVTTLMNSYHETWQGGSREFDTYLYLNPSPFDLQNPLGDSDDNDYHFLTPLYVYSRTNPGVQWSYGNTDDTYGFTPIRTRKGADMHSINVRGNMKGIYRTSDMIAEDGSTVTINGTDYVVVRMHKTGTYISTERRYSGYEACYLIPKTSEDN